MSQLRQAEAKLKELDIRVKVVTFDSILMAEDYVRDTELTWPLLLDPSQSLYSAYGMLRADSWTLYSPTSIWKYLKLMAGGEQPGKPGRDWHQLGGDVLIDPDSLVRVHHVSHSPHDRPELSSLIEVVQSSSQG